MRDEPPHIRVLVGKHTSIAELVARYGPDGSTCDLERGLACAECGAHRAGMKVVKF